MFFLFHQDSFVLQEYAAGPHLFELHDKYQNGCGPATVLEGFYILINLSIYLIATRYEPRNAHSVFTKGPLV